MKLFDLHNKAVLQSEQYEDDVVFIFSNISTCYYMCFEFDAITVMSGM